MIIDEAKVGGPQALAQSTFVGKSRGQGVRGKEASRSAAEIPPNDSTFAAGEQGARSKEQKTKSYGKKVKDGACYLTLKTAAPTIIWNMFFLILHTRA